jgi:putative membrane protein
VETAVLQIANEARGLSDLVPLAPPAALDALLRRWAPWFDAAALPWRDVHPRAWRRMAFMPVLLTVVATLLSLPFVGPGGLVLLLGVPWWRYRARRLAQNAQWAANDEVLAWRSGWLDREVSFAQIAKLQGLELVQTPFDRRRGMASLIADTAGASAFGHRLELRYLPADEARALYERLGARLAHCRLRW